MGIGIFKREKEEKGEKKTLDDFIREDDIADVGESENVNDGTDENEECAIKPTKTNDMVEKFTATPLDCFGWKKDTTEPWLAKCAKVWHIIISFFWFVFGAITFAPIIFISSKVSVLCKDKKRSLIVGAILYAVIVAILVIMFSARGSVQDVPVV